MKRSIVLGMLIAIGAVTLVVAAQQGGGQQAPKVVDVDKVKDNLFVLKGGGGNTAVFVTSTGVVVVDCEESRMGAAYS